MDSYKKLQLQETKKEIADRLSSGCTQLTVNNLVRFYRERFGLKLDLDKDNHLLKYYNVGNSQHYLHATTTVIDETGHSFANINGRYYQEHAAKRTATHIELQKARSTYFAVMRSGHILEA